MEQAGQGELLSDLHVLCYRGRLRAALRERPASRRQVGHRSRHGHWHHRSASGPVVRHKDGVRGSLDNAAAKLEYSSTSEPRKVIPQTQLRSPSLGEPPPPPDSAFKLEAETMSRPAGASVVSHSDASGARALRFTQAGNATASVTLDQAADRIVVVAKAPQGGSPDLELKVNGVDQFGNGVPVRSTAYADYPVNKALGTGTYNITIRTDAGISPSTPLDVDVSRFEGAGASPPPPPPPAAGSVTGELKKWHPVTISFNGPPSTETNSSPNPFLDYRLQVSFTSPSGKSFEVPGFYDGGSDWKVRFNPDESGTWGYKASFRQGANVAIDTNATAGSPTSFDGASGTFNISPRDPAAAGFLSQGLLEYANGHYLKFRDGSYDLKGGADSPESGSATLGSTIPPTQSTLSRHMSRIGSREIPSSTLPAPTVAKALLVLLTTSPRRG